MRASRSALLLAAGLLPLAAAQAQTAASPEPRDALHSNLGNDIIVTAPFQRERFAMTTAVSVLEGTALVRDIRPTIGETLARQPGVSASFFGPNASRPILR